MSACAGTFSISPVRLDLSAATRTAALTVRNEDREVLVQAELMLWEQVDGEDRLTPTRDLLVSPAVFTLPPNGAQLVRVALRSPPPATRELSYRLILQEVPPAAKPGFTGLQVTLRLSLPVFVAPPDATGPKLTWSAVTTADDHLVIAARNEGDAHARIHSFAVAPAAATAGADAPLVQPVATYILPGQSHSWTLGPVPGNAASDAPTHRLQLKVTTDDGDSETGLDIAGE
jgi:fimbrial chaperone protein